jgi:hypothetical protein
MLAQKVRAGGSRSVLWEVEARACVDIGGKASHWPQRAHQHPASIRAQPISVKELRPRPSEVWSLAARLRELRPQRQPSTNKARQRPPFRRIRAKRRASVAVRTSRRVRKRSACIASTAAPTGPVSIRAAQEASANRCRRTSASRVIAPNLPLGHLTVPHGAVAPSPQMKIRAGRRMLLATHRQHEVEAPWCCEPV